MNQYTQPSAESQAQFNPKIHGCTPIMLLMQQTPRAPSYVLRTYIALSSCQGTKAHCRPSVAKIALRAGLGSTKVKAGLKWLRDEGWLTCKRRKQTSSVYRLVTPSQIIKKVTQGDSLGIKKVTQGDSLLKVTQGDYKKNSRKNSIEEGVHTPSPDKESDQLELAQPDVPFPRMPWEREVAI